MGLEENVGAVLVTSILKVYELVITESDSITDIVVVVPMRLDDMGLIV